MTIMDDQELDSHGSPAKFKAGDLVFVHPLNITARVIRQQRCYDYPDWFWGNVELMYDDGVTGISNSWQIENISNE
jgi:hypothetical protein